MAKTYYLGETKAGQIVGRASNRSDFTHAACRTTYKTGEKHPLPSFSTSAAGAERNFLGNFQPGAQCEVVPVRIVTGAEYRAAFKS